MRTIFVILFSLLAFAACKPAAEPTTDSSVDRPAPLHLPAGVELVEAYAGSGADVSIPYSKYRLDNGLTIILHEDHSDPLVRVDVTYHVGSNREEPGRSGFAHFFEHMMFEGSANVAEGQHSKILSNAGGSLNGTTNSDRTNYYESMPINQLEIALWLEADRMGFLLDAVSTEKFEVQRETVKNERGQRVDNVPYGRLGETMYKSLYPPDHPYSWPVIGWIEDLDAAELDDLRRFFLRWYAPNNAQLVIGGSIDPQQTLQWVAKYFGPIARGPDVPNLVKQPAQLSEDQYVTLEDNVHLPAIAMLFPTVYYNHPDEAPLDAAAKIMGQGRASLLYQRLVQSGRAVHVSASHSCRELACEMSFIVIQNPASGETLAEMESAIRETLREFSERSVSEDDLTKFKAQIESRQVFGMQSVAGKVSALAFSELMTGDPKHVEEEFQRYAAVSLEDVRRTFSEYIEGKPSVVVSVVPHGSTSLAAGPPDAAAPQDQELRQKLHQPGDTQSPGAASQLRVVNDNFDRSVQPEPGFNPTVDLPTIQDVRLANGVRLLAVRNEETPTVTIQVIFDAGQRDEPPGKAGLASLTAAMMTEATTGRTAAEFAEDLERIGASIGVSSGNYRTTVSLNTLNKHLEQATALMMERILQPAFLESDFNRIKSHRLESLVQGKKQGSALANRAINAMLLGPEHPLSFAGGGLTSTVETITLDDVKGFYAAHIPQHLSGVLVSTNLPMESVFASLEDLSSIAVSEVLRENLPKPPATKGRTIYLVNKDDAAQSSLHIGHPSIRYDAMGDFYRAQLMNFNLGGTFDSRINLNLREDKGYTYGVRSGFYAGPETGSFRVSTEVNKDSTAASINEILGELERYSSAGMTEKELKYLQNAIGQRDALRYETPGAKLGLLGAIIVYDLPLDYRRQQIGILRESSQERLNALAADLIQPADVAIVVVGDSDELRAELEATGIPVRQLDSDGFPIGD